MSEEKSNPEREPMTPAYDLMANGQIAGLETNPEGDKVQVPCVAVSAYAIGDHKDMAPGAIRNWRYTESQEQAMAAVERDLWVKFVKMYRLPNGQLVKNPWVDIATAYVEPPAADVMDTFACGNPQLEAYAAGITAHEAEEILAGTSRSSNHGLPWAERDTDWLRSVWNRARSVNYGGAGKDKIIKNIAKRLGRSEIAIVYKLHAMGLEPST